MKYKLINNITKEEHLCNKITIDGYDYYVNEKEPKKGWRLYYENDNFNGIYGFDLINDNTNRNKYKEKSLIACNNPNIDIPKVVDKVEGLKFVYNEGDNKDVFTIGVLTGIEIGYNKSQETQSFSHEDMIEFNKFSIGLLYKKINEIIYYDYDAKWITIKELLEIWEKQRIKTLYYE